MICPKCGSEYQGNQCPNGCNTVQGTAQPVYAQPVYAQPVYVQQPVVAVPMISPKSKIAALLLCIFLGGIGIHRFYVGKVGTGILYLFTGGLFGIGVLVDIINIACGNFRDNMGMFLKK